MSKYSRIDVALAMRAQRVIPVYYNGDLETCKNVVKACYEGGVRAFEFTNRGDFAHEIFGELNKWAISELPGMMLGIGSVVDAPTASLYIQLGAAFVVSPLLNADMAKVCNRRKILWAPGCGSLSEIGYAEELGAEIVKIFPGSSVGGPGFIKGVKAPCPWSSIMPTGGVEPTEESFKKWFGAGATCVGVGSNMFSAEKLKAGDWAGVAEDVKQILAMAQSL